MTTSCTGHGAPGKHGDDLHSAASVPGRFGADCKIVTINQTDSEEREAQLMSNYIMRSDHNTLSNIATLTIKHFGAYSGKNYVAEACGRFCHADDFAESGAVSGEC